MGRIEHRKLGLSVLTSSPGWSDSTSTMPLSAMRSLLTRAAPLLSWAPRGKPSLTFPDDRVVDGGVKRRPGGWSEGHNVVGDEKSILKMQSHTLVHAHQAHS